MLFLLPPLTAQMTHLMQDFPTFRDRILSRIPAAIPPSRHVVRELFEWLFSLKVSSMLERSFAWGQSAISGLVVAAIVPVLTLYLLHRRQEPLRLAPRLRAAHPSREAGHHRRTRSPTWSTRT